MSTPSVEEQQAKAMLDMVYADRDQVVALLVWVAVRHGWRCWLALQPDFEPGWQQVVMIELPTGQVSWHIHQSELPWFRELPWGENTWDGHNNDEKHDRILSLIAHKGEEAPPAGEG